MNRIAKLGIAGIVGFAAAPAALANYQGYDWARVTDVQPIVRTVHVETPVHECWAEAVTRVQTRSDSGAVLVGALIGGAIGNQFGSGSGRRAATAAGILIGSKVGHERTRTSVPVTSYEQRCNIQTSYREERRVEGYRVTYRYRGATYVTRTQAHPGNRIRVQVTARPASF